MPTPGNGLITEDPQFNNAENQDYSLNENSPCIDAGDPDFEDADGTISDIGAIHFEQVIIPTGDCNGDDIVNILDIIEVVNDCILCEDGDGCPECGCADLNMDGQTNILDIILIVNSILT